MKVDLSQVETFTDNAIDFDKHVNFVFGKNGTGKSTLSRLIKEQFPDKDVRIFQGFESVISNGELNSVTLGAENVSVEKQINKLKRQIESKNVELGEQQIIYMSKVTEKQKVSDELNQIIKNVDKVYIESARKIKNNSYHIAPPSYNKNDFEDELRYAIPLSQEEIKQLRENLKIEERHASEYDFIDINFQEKLDKVNSILSETVKETIVISRLDTPDSIRRINETFTKFNNINDFYQGNLEAQKLLNVNSHSIDDLEADLNGKTEEDLLQIMKKCFKDNNAEKHFKAQWKLAQK